MNTSTRARRGTLVRSAPILVLFVLVAAPIFASGDAERTESITVIGEGEISAEPDQATITLGVQLYDESAQAASAELRSRMESVIAAIRALGIAERQIQTTNYSIFFERDYQTPLAERAADGRPVGIYRVENTVRVVISDVAMAASVVEAAIEAGANQMYGISFSIADPVVLDTEARELAVRDAERKADLLAGAAGRSVGRAIEITELAGGAVPYEARAMASGMGGGPMQPGETTYTARIQITYELE